MSLTTDIPQAMPILEDPSGLAGVPLAKVLEGDAAAGKNASASLVAKDDSGNLIYLRTTAAGALITSGDDPSAIACLTASAKVTGSNVAEQDVLEITLVAGKEYKDIGWIVSCFRQAEFRIVAIDDPSGTPVETELATLLVGPGDYTDSGQLECLSFTAGATDPVLRLVGLNKDAASDLRGTISIKEIQ